MMLGQKVLEVVCRLLNQAHAIFITENPEFDGVVCLLGHSLGGIICYDLLANQSKSEEEDDDDDDKSNTPDANTTPDIGMFPKTHYEFKYPTLDFKPNFLFSLGSPLGAVMVMRGQSPDTYCLPPTTKYMNIFHLFDPLVC